MTLRLGEPSPQVTDWHAEKIRLTIVRRIFCDRVYKPGSVLTVIYLGVPSPVRSSHLLGSSRASFASSAVLLRIEFTAMDAFTRHWVRSYRTFPPLPRRCKLHIPHPAASGRSQSFRCTIFFLFRVCGGISLLHFSSDHSGRALPVILALWSPDFPHARPFGAAPATVRPGRACIVLYLQEKVK